MKIKPVKNYTPGYPEKNETELKKMLLENKPNRWKFTGSAALMLAVLAASGLTSCGVPEGEQIPATETVTSSGYGTIQADETPESTDYSVPTETPTNYHPTAEDLIAPPGTRKMLIAPVFEMNIFEETTTEPPTETPTESIKQYLNAPGTYGPEPSLLITEEEALMIIRSELESLGLSVTASEKQVAVPFEGRHVIWSFDMDIAGAAEPVYAEFLPWFEYGYENENNERDSLKLPQNSEEAAFALRDRLSEVCDESTGVIFYNNYESNAEQNIRAQASEFVQWLKTNGLFE